MIGVIGESRSDAETLCNIIRRIARNDNLPIKWKGYSGCAEMLRKGASQLGLFQSFGCNRFVIAHDSDGNDPNQIRETVRTKIVNSSAVGDYCCIVVPVQEIEAWIIADPKAIRKAISSFRIKDVPNPEGIDSPKEWLIRKSRTRGTKPKYIHAAHNPKIASYIDIDTLKERCKSFEPLYQFVKHNS